LISNPLLSPLTLLPPTRTHSLTAAKALRGFGFPHAWPSDLWDATAALLPPERLLLPTRPDDDPFDEYAAWQLFAR
jgi:hypothetical protein